jgi:putative tricarboxylic transport membrane protein
MSVPAVREPSVRAVRLGTALFLLALASYVFYESFELQYYTQLGPGPGFFPRWLAGGLALCAIAMGVQSGFRTEPLPDDFLPGRAGAARIGAVLVALIAVVLLLEPLGFRLTMLAVYLGLLIALGRRGWLLTPTVALAGSFGVYHVFVQWLRVPLPVGLLGI